MLEYMKKSVFLFLAMLFLSVSVGHVAHAQHGLALMVQPTTIEKTVDPGQSLEGNLTITNKNGGKQIYFISSRNVEGVNDTGTPTFSTEFIDDPLEAASWLKPEIKSVSLDVNESVQVPYRIEVPENASPGSYAAAFFVTREADAVTESGAGVGFHVASLVLIRVSGEAFEDMMFREFMTGKSFFTKPNVFFSARLENTGTVHQRPRGIIAIQDMFGNDVDTIWFNEGREGAILPHEDRVFSVTWEHDGFVVGRFTAIASVLFGESQNKTITREVSFWVIPVKELAIVFGILATVLLAFVYGVKRYIKNALRQSGHTSQEGKEKMNITFARRLARTAVRLVMLFILLLLVMVALSL